MPNRPITRDEALEQAVKLRKQGLTYSKIAAHLNSLGLLDRAGKSMTQQAVRYMVINTEKLEKQEVKQELEDELRFTNDRTFKQHVKTLLGLKEFSSDMKLKLLEVIAEDKVGENIVPILERLDRAHQQRKVSGDS